MQESINLIIQQIKVEESKLPALIEQRDNEGRPEFIRKHYENELLIMSARIGAMVETASMLQEQLSKDVAERNAADAELD